MAQKALWFSLRNGWNRGNLLILAENLSKIGLYLSIQGNNLRILLDNLLILGFIPPLTKNIQTVRRLI
ncbi:hypothetical protein ACKA06_01445 [Rossellomorea oryzaecorticis]|uniref:Uncharacterized protein n=1 Tax=Rossellomorea oryzaecorticis TaxID=1396505 RepID=A0ABW8VJ54_9BACI